MSHQNLSTNLPTNRESVRRHCAGDRMIEWRLSIGNRFTGLVVCPDPQWPNMWRIHYGGRISDMVNLVRAKDAAISWVRAERQGGAKGVRWERRETPAEGSSVAPNEPTATSPPDKAAHPPPVEPPR